MKIDIYVQGDRDLAVANSLSNSYLSKQSNFQLDSINLDESEEIPASVLEVMMLKKEKTFPLTLANGYPVLSGRFPQVEEIDRLATEGVEKPAVLVDRAFSAVHFPTDKRIHCNIIVRDVYRSVVFYRTLFNQNPVKHKKDYAKFELEEPPLNLSLLQNDEFGNSGQGSINHLGIQVKDSNAIVEAKERLTKAGFKFEEEVETAGCYAVQTKIWVPDPDGNLWEVFLVIEPEANQGCTSECICYQEMSQNSVGSVTENCCQPATDNGEYKQVFSAVDFPGEKRIHANIITRDVKRSLAYYQTLFNAKPVKVKSDYAKFEIDEPRINLSILQKDDVDDFGEGLINHLGIQVKDSEAIAEVKERLLQAGFNFEEEKQEACCYAVQTKIWAPDPDGNRWEVFVVVEAEADEGCGPDCICYYEMMQNVEVQASVAV
jgi:catechol 2,3-dioxygenase-like lactoylglutathione lyase family enzyme